MDKKIITLVLLVIALGVGIFYYIDRKSNENNVMYGTNINSMKEKDECEQKTGKRCLFDLCQEEMGFDLNNYHCVSGWKPIYE